MTKVMILCGYLGSGKTTLLTNLLRNHSKKEKIAVIINEFAAIGVDGRVVSKDGIEVKELSNGCVCCTKGAELGKTIQQLIDDQNPDLIIVEASGVASIESFQSIISQAGAELSGVIAVVDAKRFSSSSGFGPVARKQIEMASVTVINKSDLVDKNSVADLKTSVLSINNTAKTLITSRGMLTIDDISVSTPVRIPLAKRGKLYKIAKNLFPAVFLDKSSKHLKKSGLGSVAFRTFSPISRHKFELFLRQIPEYIYRAKGVVNFPGEPTQLFNYASGLITFEPHSKERMSSDIVMIGKISPIRRISLLISLSQLKEQKSPLYFHETVFNMRNFIKSI